MQTLIQARPLTLETGARLPLVLRLQPPGGGDSD